MDSIEDIKKEEILDLMKDMTYNNLAIAYIYAKNYAEYGEDVTVRWQTATEQASILDKVYMRGYYDGFKDREERRST